MASLCELTEFSTRALGVLHDTLPKHASMFACSIARPLMGIVKFVTGALRHYLCKKELDYQQCPGDHAGKKIRLSSLPLSKLFIRALNMFESVASIAGAVGAEGEFAQCVELFMFPEDPKIARS